MIWAAGVRASPAAEWLGAPADRAGRLQVGPTSPFPAIPISSPSATPSTIAGPDGKPVPGIAPAAKQQGRYVADAIKARLRRRQRWRRSVTSMPAAWRRSASGWR